MSKEEKSFKIIDGVTIKMKSSPFNSGALPSQCTLIGSVLCPHPQTCSGYNNRQCDLWERHSSK